MSMIYFDRLPVEILYRIYDYLDIETIVFAIRYVCRQLYLTTNSYNRYKFHFKTISKRDLQFLCRLISFENVISLLLSDEDQTRGQITFFLSLYSLENFLRLKSLILLQITDESLKILSSFLLNSNIQSLTITLQTSKQTLTQFSSIISHSTLKYFNFNIGLTNWNNIEWPNYSTLESLCINTNLNLKYFCHILQHSPHLKRLILREIIIDENEENLFIQIFPQLTSLTFQHGRIELVKLERCLSLTPSLIDLKLIGDSSLFNSSFDGYLWQKLIQTKLHSLKNFEFFISILTYSNYRRRNLEILIQSFQTTFWLDELHCSIQCDYVPNSRKIMLYTLPICSRYFVYPIDIKKISLTNFSSRIQDNDMNHVQRLVLNLTKDIQASLFEQTESSNHVVFHNVTNLILGNDGEWPTNSQRFLSSTLDLSKINKLSLSVNFFPEYLSKTVANINRLFSQTTNLRSLLLYDYWTSENCTERLKIICSLITSNIKHLQIRVKDLNDIKYILEKLDYLTSVTFEYAQMFTINRDEFLQSLDYLDRYSSIWNCQNVLHVWLGNKKPKLTV